jgi:hypothetical protein
MGRLPPPLTASTEPPVPSAGSSIRDNTSMVVHPSEPGRLSGPLLPRVGTPTVSFNDTAAASSSRCSFSPLPVQGS